MSRKELPTQNSDSIHSQYSPSNHKVIEYLQNSVHCLKNNTNTTANNVRLSNECKKSSPTNILTDEKDVFTTNNYNKVEQPSGSNNCLTTADLDTLSRFTFNFGLGLSDPGGNRGILSSNASSSGIYSTFSETGHEENVSETSQDLDFNIGFDQTSNVDDIDVDDIDEIDQVASDQLVSKQISHRSSDASTLLDFEELTLEAQINDLEGLLRKSSSSTSINSNKALNNNDIRIGNQSRLERRLQDNDPDDDNRKSIANKRSNSLGIPILDTKSALLDEPPKKVVRFADMLGLDLESIRYMTPPDQSANSVIQECIRIKLEQLRQAKSPSSSISSSPYPFYLQNIINRSSSSVSLNTVKKSKSQYCLVSKFFTPPIDIIPLVYNKQVMLECLYTNESTAYGTIRVHNLTYEKRVFVRVTEDDWQTSEDINGWHSIHDKNNNTDTFTFEIRLKKYDDTTKVPKQLYFAVCLIAADKEYWDNNLGWNYLLDVIERR